ncbi:ElyC/SanA/YdcF family protein [Catenovulum adriaticum]|uniref:YdcF family protein n=1 Tax=Catenovulum adriaticum TaxID=2984846 RepID=A0ABY7AMA9_9ALTE|nr:ElyC/SanA/YdcF family protein [Catenovulum sp. TS8]WAJ70679.1 YdcF family protein [Catenovulum sp. TS8]
MEFLFSVKKILGVLISPLPVSVLLLIAGSVLLLKTAQFQYRKYVKIFIFSGVGLLILASSPITAFYLLRPIETAYPKYQDELKKVDNIVVLGCYHSSDKQLPDIANVHPCSLYRLIEALRLSRVYPSAQLYLTGWQSDDEHKMSHPEYSAKILMSLGVDRHRITAIEGSKDTEEEVLVLKPVLRHKQTLVVSSASHFYRAMKLFDAHNVKVTPVPIEYLTHKGGPWSWRLLIPDPDALQMTQRAIYEYLGNIWVNVKSEFEPND